MLVEQTTGDTNNRGHNNRGQTTVSDCGAERHGMRYTAERCNEKYFVKRG